VRRITAHPVPLTDRPHDRDGWLLGGLDAGPVEKFQGPYLLSGGWWRSQIERDYYFAELRSGLLLWVFYDRRRRRWLMQGKVS
jgi:protein ImuB